MKHLVRALFAASLALQPAAGWAQHVPALPLTSEEQLSRPEGPLAASVRHDVSSSGRSIEATGIRHAAQESTAGQRSWIARHPVLFGTLVGTGAGLVAGGTMNNELICQKGNDEDCLFYNGSRFAVAAGVGAGLGALIGWIAGR